MNPVERDIRGYFGIAPEDSILEHYGTKRHSGRYPWGSGENPYQRSGDFLSRVEELKKSGMKEKDILQTINDSLPEEYKMGATEFRMAQRRAIHERQQLKYDRARALSQDGLGPTEIGREMGLSESTVRSMLKNDKPDKYITKQYLIIPRGAAKTMYDAFIQSYFLTVDVSTTQQCTTAPTMKQAEEVLSPIRTALARSKGPLLKFMTEGSLQNTTGAKADRVKLASTKKGIENFLTNSLLEVRPMTIDKLQGRRDRVATVDEWLSCDIREDPISALEQGASKNEDYLIVATSSEGTVRNGCGDTIKMELMDILKGEYINPHVSIWYYKLDSIDEVTNPDMWLKANPNLGQTVSYETYQLDVERAEKAPGSRNDILAKRFNIPMEGYTYFFPYEETLPHRHRDYWQMPCALGADLSQGDDFCAFTFLFPMANGFFGVKTRDYITSYTLSKLPQAMRQKYDQFMQEGTLQVFDGTVLDMMQVYDDLDTTIRHLRRGKA